MRVLIWCPFVNRGGGQRLLLRLVEAFSACDSIHQLGLVLPPGSFGRFAPHATQSSKVRIFEVPHVKLRNWNRLDFLPRTQGWLRNWSRSRGRRRLENFLRKIASCFD